MRLIDAHKLYKQYETSMRELVKSTNCENISLEVLSLLCGAKLIADAPTVEAVPVKHGRWQWISSTYDRTPCEMRYMCDKCRHETITHGHEPWEKYCPNCGAKMDLEEQDAKEEP